MIKISILGDTIKLLIYAIILALLIISLNLMSTGNVEDLTP